jgi:hypothetical protein
MVHPTEKRVFQCACRRVLSRGRPGNNAGMGRLRVPHEDWVVLPDAVHPATSQEVRACLPGRFPCTGLEVPVRYESGLG